MSTPISLAITAQDGSTIVAKQLAHPVGSGASAWTYLIAGLGAHVFADGTLRLSNGVYDGDGVGTVYFARIVVTFDAPPVFLPRAGWNVAGNVLTIGSGQECIAPRAHFTVRQAASFDRMSRVSTFRFCAKQVPYPLSMKGLDDWRKPRLLACLASGTADSYGARLFTGNLGLWHPYGDPLPNQGGGWDIEPIGNGWNGDSALDILRHDLGQERQTTDCLSRATGEPVPFSPALVAGASYYALSRGWSKVTQLPRFCMPGAGPNPDARVPIWWNSGTCLYYETIHGFYVGSQPGFLPHDGQHIVRVACYARAARDRWGDLCAAFDMRMMQQDARYAWTSVPVPSIAQGSTSLGRRECAEVTSLCEWQELASAASIAQMPNGGVMRCGSDLQSLWGFNPDPWTPQFHDGVNWPPLSMNADAEQTYERTMQAVAFADNLYLANADRALRPFYLPTAVAGRVAPSLLQRAHGIPKWVAVADQHGAPHRAIVEWADWGDFISEWVGVGAGALMSPDYLPAMLLLPSPASSPLPTHPANYAQLQVRLLGDLTARSQYVPALSALEAAGL